jgi:hypothetical protein
MYTAVPVPVPADTAVVRPAADDSATERASSVPTARRAALTSGIVNNAATGRRDGGNATRPHADIVLSSHQIPCQIRRSVMYDVINTSDVDNSNTSACPREAHASAEFEAGVSSGGGKTNLSGADTPRRTSAASNGQQAAGL